MLTTLTCRFCPALAAAGSLLFAQLSHGAALLEEVIVSAEKREQALRDVPISIAAFSADTLEKMGVHDIKGLASKVPNVVVKEFTGSSTSVLMFIRGVGQSDVQVTQDPSVALYMDGVYIGSSVGTAFESADLQRIEVLRGPQGTLYGRNATGGAINLVTRPADPEALSFRQRITAGNYDLLRSRSILNLPLAERAAIKLAYSYSDRDGVVDNLGAGEDWGTENRDNITVDVHWQAAADVNIDYKYDRSTIEDSSRLSQLLRWNPSAPGAAVISFANPGLDSEGFPVEVDTGRLDRATSFDDEQTGDVTIDAHTFKLSWAINEKLDFSSISAYREVDAFNQLAQSPTTSLLGTFSIVNGVFDTRFEQFSQELQIAGLHEQLDWVGGLYYYRDEASDNSIGDSNGSESIPRDQLQDYTATENSSVAIYGQATWTPRQLARWHFTLGARYSDDNRKAARINNRVSYGFGGAPTPVPAFRASYDRDFDQFNPSFSVEYDIGEFANLYAKVVSAYKSGGTSQRSTSAENFQAGFEPEELLSWELGYKADLLSGRLRVNAALFHMEYDDYQQSVQTGRNAGERDFINIDDAEISGIEFDLTAALSSQLTGTLSYGYLNSSFGPSSVRFRQIDDSASSGFRTVEQALTDQLALAPEHSLALSLDYTRPLGFAVFNANINLQYQDESFSGVEVPSGVLNERSLLAATLSLAQLSMGAGTLRVSLWGHNLLDEEYHVGNIRQASFEALGIEGVATFGDPLSYGVTLEYQY